MRIVIVGAGNAGLHLADQACREKHDVVVVDSDPRPLDAIDSQMDSLTVLGNGSSPRVLEEAEIGKADLLVAVTNHDEVNILAGSYAHLAGVTHVVVRVSDPEFRVFALLWLGAALFMGVNTHGSHYETLGESMRASFFLVTSIITTTGYGTENFDLWPTASRVLFVLLMICGGCAGSTAGGMKIVRLFVVFKKTLREVRLFM